jgi:hypothetical protein
VARSLRSFIATAVAVAALTGASSGSAAVPSAAIWNRAGVFVGDTHAFPGPSTLAEALAANGFSWIAIQIHNGLVSRRVDQSWLSVFRAHGLAVGGWGVELKHPRREARLAAQLVGRYGLDFYIADGEASYKIDTGGVWGRSAAFTRTFRALEPTLPAAFTTYGAPTCTCVFPIDYAAWRRTHFALLPQAFYNQFREYRPDRTVAHALRAGWRRSEVHPVVGVYHGFPAARYVPLLRRAHTVGFSVFVAEAAHAGDYAALAPAIRAETRTLPTFSNGPAGAPVALSPPVLAGRAVAGAVLTAAPGAWAGAEPLAAEYGWERCAGAVCTPILGVEGPVYVVGAVDVGFTLRVSVRESNPNGAATAVSPASAAVRVGASGLPRPSFRAPPARGRSRAAFLRGSR